MKRSRPSEGQLELTLPILTAVVPNGDGTYRLKPIVPPDGVGETWLPTAQACRVMGWPNGDLAQKRLARLADAGLIRVRKPTPMRREYELASLLKHKQATEDPEFWDGTDRSAFRS